MFCTVTPEAVNGKKMNLLQSLSLLNAQTALGDECWVFHQACSRMVAHCQGTAPETRSKRLSWEPIRKQSSSCCWCSHPQEAFKKFGDYLSKHKAVLAPLGSSPISGAGKEPPALPCAALGTRPIHHQLWQSVFSVHSCLSSVVSRG